MKNIRKSTSIILSLLFVFILFTFSVLTVSASEYKFRKILGDIDGDDSITISDSSRIQMYSAKLIDQSGVDFDVSDVNNDIKTDIVDATRIQQYLAKICSFSGEEIYDNKYIYQYYAPEYEGDLSIEINNNIPYFEEDEITTTSYQYFSELDDLGRCGYVMGSLYKDMMPTGKRGSISGVTPSGWNQAQYDIVSGKYLYNRSHLIGWQLTGENANKLNLITGTRTFNAVGMLEYENMTASVIRENDIHVMYRVRPVFTGDDLVCRGVEMEGYSVEDSGELIDFNVFVFNVEPGIVIDYSDGSSHLE